MIDLLQSGISNYLSEIVANADAVVQSAFKSQVGTVIGYATTIAGALFTLTFGWKIVLNVSLKEQLSYDFVFPYLFLFFCLGSYETVMGEVDALLDKPATAFENQAAQKLDYGEKVVRAYDLAKIKYDDKKVAEIKAAHEEDWTPFGEMKDNLLNTFSSENITYYIWRFIVIVMNIITSLVVFGIKIVQKYGLGLLYAIGPLSIAFSFVKPLEGSAIGWLKYYIVFKLWGMVLGMTTSAYATMGVYQVLAEGDAAVDYGNVAYGGDVNWTIVMMQGISIIFMIMTPKFADIIVSGAQGGGFFSAAMGSIAAGGAKVVSTVKTATGAATGAAGMIGSAGGGMIEGLKTAGGGAMKSTEGGGSVGKQAGGVLSSIGQGAKSGAGGGVLGTVGGAIGGVVGAAVGATVGIGKRSATGGATGSLASSIKNISGKGVNAASGGKGRGSSAGSSATSSKGAGSSGAGSNGGSSSSSGSASSKSGSSNSSGGTGVSSGTGLGIGKRKGGEAVTGGKGGGSSAGSSATSNNSTPTTQQGGGNSKEPQNNSGIGKKSEGKKDD